MNKVGGQPISLTTGTDDASRAPRVSRKGVKTVLDVIEGVVHTYINVPSK